MNREELLEEFRITMKIIQRCMEQEHYATVEIICRDVLRTLDSPITQQVTPQVTPEVKWVGLTDDERHDVLEDATGDGGHVYYDTLFRTIETKLKEKNT